jgi:hypothetical protein
VGLEHNLENMKWVFICSGKFLELAELMLGQDFFPILDPSEQLFLDVEDCCWHG